jgi:hypothetical protein
MLNFKMVKIKSLNSFNIGFTILYKTLNELITFYLKQSYLNSIFTTSMHFLVIYIPKQY